MTTAAFLLAIFQAIPALHKMYLESIDLYFKQQAAADNTNYDRKKVARDAIIASMMKPGVTDEELRDFRRALYDLNH